MKIKISNYYLAWWTQAIFWLDVVRGTEFYSTSFFLAAVGLGIGTWLIRRWI